MPADPRQQDRVTPAPAVGRLIAGYCLVALLWLGGSAYAIFRLTADERARLWWLGGDAVLLVLVTALLFYRLLRTWPQAAPPRAPAPPASPAERDSLTGLADAGGFEQSIERCVARARAAGRGVVVAHLDIVDFQLVNAALGKDGGDNMLRQFAARLERHGAGPAQAARLQGNAFALCEDRLAADPDTARREAAQWLTELEQSLCGEPYSIQDTVLYINACIGLSLLPGDAESAADLNVHAARALHHARRRGEYRQQFYRPEIDQAVGDRLQLLSDLREALASDQLTCHYQPIVDLRSGRCVGAEALVRWFRRGAWVSPISFLPLAEEAGLMPEVGRKVMRRSAEQTAAWHQSGALPKSFRVSVNLSVTEVDERFDEYVEAQLLASGLNASALTVELTESTFLRQTEVMKAALRGLRGRGVSVAIDDFGTGYSSMSRLHLFPLDVLKVDRSFVEGLPDSRESTAIVSALLSLAGGLNLATVAEGIETEAQREALIRLGCPQGQGFLFSAALPAEAFVDWVAARSVSA